jgi:microcystin-dependent protein
MPTLKYRDPNSGQWVPILGGMTQAEMDAAYLQSTGGTVTGPVSVPAPTTDASAVPKSYVDTVFTGLILSYAGPTAPAGWLLCQGQVVSRTTYPTLFAAIGVQYGVGDGSTTFVIPNLQGRIVAGFNAGDGYFSTVGQVGGAKTHNFSWAEVPNSAGSATMHNAGVDTMIHGLGAGYWDTGHAPNNYSTGYDNYNGNSSKGNFTTNLGFSGQPHNNLQPYINLQYIIRT